MARTRLIAIDDAEELLALRLVNRDFLAPWEPSPAADALTLKSERGAVERLLDAYQNDSALPHVILDQGQIIGRITLSNIVRGPLQSCNLGYWVAQAHNGRGHAKAAVAEICALAFGQLGLHRVEAGTLLHNTASQRVLTSNGFVQFGIAPQYLHIAGRWQDHILFQRLAPAAPAA